MAIKRIDIVERLSGRGILFEKDGKKLGEGDYEINVHLHSEVNVVLKVSVITEE